MTSLHKKQSEIATDDKRFKVIRAGRRSGKTIYITEEIKAVSVLRDGATAIYIAPNQRQARKIIWRNLKKQFVGSGAEPKEGQLEIETKTVNGGSSLVALTGYENIESVRGQNADLIVIDEVDSMPDFIVTFQEVIKPLLLDKKGSAIFIGTPKDSNPNLSSLEDLYGDDPEWGFYHFTSYDNPHLPKEDLDKDKEVLSPQSFRQEYLAEYGDGSTRLFDPVAVSQMFTIELPEDRDKTPYYVIDPAGQGEDKTAMGRWEGLECWISEEKGLTSDDIEDDVLRKEAAYSIPRENIMLDGVGLGDAIADRQRIQGVTVFKGSFSPVKTDRDISKAIDTGIYEINPTSTEFANLRTQTYFALARAISERKIKVHCTVEQAEEIKRELNTTVELENQKKKLLIPKDEIRRIVGHSPDKSDVLAMRMFYYLRKKASVVQELAPEMVERQSMMFARNRHNKSSRTNI